MRDILIVEDGLHERERLNKLFANAGYLTNAAEGVEEAKSILAETQFRLIILDVGLGDKSGSYLFEYIRTSGLAPYVIIFTGNPSVHLKQRFLDEGAVAYIVKASPQAENNAFLGTVQTFLGHGRDLLFKSDSTIGEKNDTPTARVIDTNKSGIPLDVFISQYVDESSRGLFLDAENKIPPCSYCGKSNYVVIFHHKTQLPPLVEGRVVCALCSRDMDPELG